MWKLAIVLCATAAFFASTNAVPSTPIPVDHHEEEDASTPESELVSPEASSTPMIKLEEGLGVVINQTLEMVKNHHIKVYREILARGPLDPQISIAIASNYTTKLQIHLELIKSFVDDLISWGKQHGSFDENECRSLHKSYNDLMTELVLNVTKSAPAQAFHEVSLEFAEMLAQVNKILRALPAKLSTHPKMTVQKIHELSRSYYEGFTSRTDQLLVKYESMFNGKAIEEIVRRDWDMMIAAVPDVINETYECVTRSLSESDSDLLAGIPLQ